MRRVRFLADGRVHEGEWPAGRPLQDAAGRPYAEEDVTFLPPFRPGKILGLALSYAEHAEELGFADQPPEPVLFLKPLSAVVGHRTPVVYPHGAKYMHYETELAVVMGRSCRRAPGAKALDYVAGYTIANDVTVRDFVGNMYRPPIKAKGFDTFCPLGPFLAVDEIADPHNLGLRAYVNGELRQEGHTRRLHFTIGEIIEFITAFMTLEAGDVILTGTPRGISHIHPGDEVRLEIDGLGALVNPIVAEQPQPPQPNAHRREATGS